MQPPGNQRLAPVLPAELPGPETPPRSTCLTPRPLPLSWPRLPRAGAPSAPGVQPIAGEFGAAPSRPADAGDLAAPPLPGAQTERWRRPRSWRCWRSPWGWGKGTSTALRASARWEAEVARKGRAGRERGLRSQGGQAGRRRRRREEAALSSHVSARGAGGASGSLPAARAPGTGEGPAPCGLGPNSSFWPIVVTRLWPSEENPPSP